MKMETRPSPPMAHRSPVASPEVFQQIGTITRLLHDTMQQLGVMPKLQIAADGLPDARSRLSYIANKTAEAADKVLNSVDQAKAEHGASAQADARPGRRAVADPVQGRGQRRGDELRARRRGAHRAHRPAPDRHHDGAGLPRPHRPGGGQGGERWPTTWRTAWSSCWCRWCRPSSARRSTTRVDVLHGSRWSTHEGRLPTWWQDQGEVDDLLASLGFCLRRR
jgi:hypothetical protein